LSKKKSDVKFNPVTSSTHVDVKMSVAEGSLQNPTRTPDGDVPAGDLDGHAVGDLHGLRRQDLPHFKPVTGPNTKSTEIMSQGFLMNIRHY
jgi:hypothetical protein